MSSSWYLMSNKFYSGNEKDEFENYAHDGLNELLTYSPESYNVTINSLSGVKVIIQKETGSSAMKIIGNGGDFKTGDIVNHENKIYLINKEIYQNRFYSSSSLTVSPSTLKWISDSRVVETPFIVHRDFYGLGIINDRIMTLPDEKRYIAVQNNVLTREFIKGQKFIFDNKAWSITAIDSLTVVGLIQLTLDETTINTAEDNMELRVAGYYANIADYKLKILTGDFSIQAGKSLQLDVELRNRNAIVTKPLLYSSSNPSIATVDNTGLIHTIANGITVITVQLAADPTIQAYVNCNVQFSVQDNYTVELVEDAYVNKNSTKTFTAIVKNNGVVDASKFVNWYVYADDKLSSTSLVTVVSSSTTQLTLKGNSSTSGYIQLMIRVIGISGDHWIRVQVKGLI